MAIAILRYVSNYGTPPAEKEVTLVSGNYTFTSDDLPVLTCNGYSFAGWFFDGEYIEAGDVLSADDGEVIELYAGWGEVVMPTEPEPSAPPGKGFILRYDSEHGDVPEFKSLYVTSYTLTAADLPMLESEAYTFIGWEYNGTVVRPGDTINAGFTTEVTLTAVWRFGRVHKYFGNASLEHYHGKMVDYVGDRIDKQAVKYGVAQELTDEQKTQARDNIDAAAKEYVDAQISNKVEKVDGKGLSTEDYSTADKTKVESVEEGAKNTVILMASWTKDNVPMILTMSISGTTYPFENGTTWGDWVNSRFNTDGYYVATNGAVRTKNGYWVCNVNSELMYQDDVIIKEHKYRIHYGGGGGEK